LFDLDLQLKLEAIEKNRDLRIEALLIASSEKFSPQINATNSGSHPLTSAQIRG